MRKIPTLFVRDSSRRFVVDQVTAGCEWVAAGEGRSTRKWDGTACQVHKGELRKRVTVRPGRPAPPGFELVEVDTATGKRYGWAPLQGPGDHWHREGWANLHALGTDLIPDGTYELVGPKVNGNPDGFATHTLIRHGWFLNAVELADFDAAPRDYHALAVWLHARPYEGIVWHHPDGRMVKAKRRDFPTPVVVRTPAAGFGVAA